MTGRLRIDEITGVANGPVAAPGGMTFSNKDAVTKGVLDWYEEGTFTPYVYGATAAGVGTYTAISLMGCFVRIGNVCTINLRMDWTAHTGSGALKIGGLPYWPSTGGHFFPDLTNGVGAIPLGLQKIAGGAWMHGDGGVYINNATAYTTATLATTGGVIMSGSFITG